MTPRSEMHPASYVFGSDGIINQTGGWNTGLSFLFGLLSVQWTVSVPDPAPHLRAYMSAAVRLSRMIGASACGLMHGVPVQCCRKVQPAAQSLRLACLCTRQGAVAGQREGTCSGLNCVSQVRSSAAPRFGEAGPATDAFGL